LYSGALVRQQRSNSVETAWVARDVGAATTCVARRVVHGGGAAHDVECCSGCVAMASAVVASLVGDGGCRGDCCVFDAGWVAVVGQQLVSRWEWRRVLRVFLSHEIV